MKRKLTWKEAWLKLHRAWNKPRKSKSGCWYTDSSGAGYGLCPGIHAMFSMGRIDYTLCRSMELEIFKLQRVESDGTRNEGGLFRFPTNRKGARQRAAFCLRMSKTREPK